MAAGLPGVRTTCPYCGVGCGVVARPDGQGGAAVAGDEAHPANGGRLCVKGAALGETLSTRGRLLHPEIDGVRVSWDRALDHVSDGFRRTMERHGPEAVAFYLSGQLLTEDYYVANKLAKGFIGTPHVDTNSRLCMASSVSAHRRAFGTDIVPAAYEDLEEADLLVLAGSNAAWCHPVLFQRMQATRGARGTRLVNIDPRETATTAGADLQLSLEPGTDGVLFSHLLVEIARRGAVDRPYVAAHTTGFDAALARAKEIAPNLAAVARRCDLPASAVARFVDLWIGTERVVTLYSQGVNQSRTGTDTVNALLNCHLATGRIGRPGCGPLSLTGQPNAMGGREVGGLANMLAAHMGYAPEEVDRVRRFWGAPRMATAEGFKAVRLFDEVARGSIKALWVMHTNPAVSLPKADRVREALRRLDLLVVSEATASTDTLLAAPARGLCLLPAAAWGEKDGTVTNSERRISRQRSFLPPPGEARPDWWMAAEVARRMGFSGFAYAGPADIFREHAALSAFENDGSRLFDLGGLASITDAAYDDLSPVRWPVRVGETAGPARLFADGRFPTPDGRAHLVAIAPPDAIEPDADHRFRLNTGRVRDHWHTMTRTGLSPRLARHTPEPFVEIHPEDAAALGLGEGDHAEIRTKRGRATLRVRLAPGGRRGCLFAPIHWNDATAGLARVGALVHDLVDPISGQPDSKATPAAVVPAPMRAHGFILARHTLPDLPRRLPHARLSVRGGTASLFTSPLEPEALHALLGNWLPGGAERLAFADAERGLHRTVMIADGRLSSALFVAPKRDDAAFERLLALFEAGASLTAAERAGLLAGRAAQGVGGDASPIVCSCHGVRRARIEAAIEGGARTLDAVGAASAAGTNCGSCRPEIKGILHAHQRIAVVTRAA